MALLTLSTSLVAAVLTAGPTATDTATATLDAQAAAQQAFEAGVSIAQAAADAEGGGTNPETAGGLYREAAAHYRIAAEAGHRGAAMSLAMLQANGEGGPEDLEGAIHWMARAAELGDGDDRAAHMARMYRERLKHRQVKAKHGDHAVPLHGHGGSDL